MSWPCPVCNNDLDIDNYEEYIREPGNKFVFRHDCVHCKSQIFFSYVFHDYDVQIPEED
jgi:hypothetical protein